MRTGKRRSAIVITSRGLPGIFCVPRSFYTRIARLRLQPAPTREYRFIEALPKNNYGKVLKTELRRLLTEPLGEERGSR